jgi:hypothetical protein
VAPLEHVVHPEGHVAWMMMKENLNDPKTLTPDKFLRMTPLIKMSPCSDQKLKVKNISQLNVTSPKKRLYKNKPRE